MLERKGVIVCFVKSLKASNNGWSKPIKDTLFGPIRLWNKPITLRSKRVKKATERRISKQWTIQDKLSKNTYKVCSIILASLVLKTKILILK